MSRMENPSRKIVYFERQKKKKDDGIVRKTACECVKRTSATLFKLRGLKSDFRAFYSLTCTPRMPKMMKKAQQMRTMLPMGLREVMRVSTTSFRPGARLITLIPQEQKSNESHSFSMIFFFFFYKMKAFEESTEQAEDIPKRS